MLTGGVVDQHHRKTEFLFPVHGLEPEDSCSGLFTASDDIWNQLGIILMDHGHEVSSIVDDDVRTGLDHSPDTAFIFLGGSSMHSEHVQTFMNEGSSYIVLGGERIASSDKHLRSAFRQHFA